MVNLKIVGNRVHGVNLKSKKEKELDKACKNENKFDYSHDKHVESLK